MRSETSLKSVFLCVVIALFASPYAIAGTWTTVNFPGTTHTRVHDIYGSSFVGLYTDALGDHAFLYDGANWETLEVPGATKTMWAYGIEGDKIVGFYEDGSKERGFIYEIPEPCTLLLLGLGAAIARKRN